MWMCRSTTRTAAFDFLTSGCDLPVRWQFGTHGMLTTGAVVLGNTYLETLQSLSPTDNALAPPSMSAVECRRASRASATTGTGPGQTLAELDRRGIQHTPPHPALTPTSRCTRTSCFPN